MQANQMHILQAARWAERNGCVYRVGRDGQPDFMAAAVNIRDNKVLCMGFGDKAWDFKAAHPDMHIRVYSLDDVLADMDADEGERNCIPGPREPEYLNA